MIDRANLLVDILHSRADREPDATAYELVGRDGPTTVLSYGSLAGRASALARQLAGCGDGPVLLLYPAGLEYVVAVFAGFLAGRPVIPAYPPDQSSLPDRRRLSGIVEDARPSVVLAPGRHPGFPAAAFLSVPGPEADGTSWYRPAGAEDQRVAIIQYTSGSTGRPRGVLVRHDSVAANTAAIAEAFGLTAASRGMTWLPPYHDMGLVGGLLAPMSAGIPVRVMPPEDFLKAPLSWLRQITEHGITVSGGPDFAYQLCVRRAHNDAALEGLDLSGWSVAFSGGETVKQQTMAAFAERFGPVGFAPEAFVPCYGLAEATLIVSAGHWSGPTADGTVSCGTPVTGQRVTVVDPDTGAPRQEGQEGEIWIAGEHVTAGYHSADSTGLFGELDGGTFLRTGDLGRLRAGELTVTGRAKDVIVFRGANHHASDVEAPALEVLGRRAGTAAAFLVDGPSPCPVLVAEVRGERTAELASQVRAAVLAATRLPLGLVVLVQPRTVPRTSSGKVRRSRCREEFLAGVYGDAVVDDPGRLGELSCGQPSSAAADELTTLVCGIVAGVRNIPECRPTDGLVDLGLDSVLAAEAAAVLEDALELPVPLATVLSAATPQDVANGLVKEWLAEGRAEGAVLDRVISVLKGEAVA
ncbi:fatty acyl-AMP ligase [Streptomyces sp. MUM 2J]|uniref:fatty acyl-AMP ligase n=1 Tax=Streptomyces sp. MUM 2J TaxID=2791987 RepID=UPI001F04936C|nr:fatty acyl-AMP ligase [Streptomyces sp. MUM 2J]MCH0563660.1 fatty acyl-AMP ligase [Streptomyces sp. MUM 2J]